MWLNMMLESGYKREMTKTKLQVILLVSKREKCIWTAILEKAYTKLYGSRNTLKDTKYPKLWKKLI